MSTADMSWEDFFRSWLDSPAGDPNTKIASEFMFGHELSRAQRPTAPLYHYTTFQGLQGILKNRSFWATEVAYLNDGTERTYARQALESLFASHENQHPGTAVSAVLDEARRYLDFTESNWAQFVTCFCEEGDLLNMWMGYAGRGGGFSLGFDPMELYGFSCGPRNHFVKVVYGTDPQSHPAFEALRQACARIAVSPSGEIRPAELGPTIACLLDILFIGVKHDAFVAEKEWRAIERRAIAEPYSSFKDVKFRGGDFNVKPYIELELPTDDDTPATEPKALLPVVDVVVGPTLRPIETIRAVRWLLRSLGYPESVSVRSSSVPYRL